MLYSDHVPLSSNWRYEAPEELAEGETYTPTADVYGFSGTVYAVCYLLDQVAHSLLCDGIR